MKQLFFSVLIFLIGSCASNSVCDCVEAGNELNQFSSEQFMKETRSSEDVAKMDALQKDRDAVCTEFQNMLSKDLQEAAADCDALIIKEE